MVLEEMESIAPRSLYFDGLRLTRFMDRIYVASRPYELDTNSILELCKLRLKLLASISDKNLRDQVIDRMIALIAEVSISSDAILDFGTGTGELIDVLCDRIQGSRICGVDMCIDSLLAAHARNMLLINAHGPLPFQTDTFDVITSLFVLHFRLPGGIRKDLLRVLKPGGHFIGNVYGYDVDTYEREMRLSGWELCKSVDVPGMSGHRVDSWHAERGPHMRCLKE